MSRGFDNAEVCFVLNQRGYELFSDLLKNWLCQERREEFSNFLRGADRISRNAEGDTLWYFHDVDWTCGTPFSIAWCIHSLFICMDAQDFLYLVVNHDDELHLGELETSMDPRVVRSIDFIPHQVW